MLLTDFDSYEQSVFGLEDYEPANSSKDFTFNTSYYKLFTQSRTSNIINRSKKYAV